MLYDDGKIACDDTGLIIRQYYPWGAKKIPYSSIKSVKRWWNLDRARPEKEIALDIDTGRRIHPTITPGDPQTVERILAEHLAASETSREPA